MSDTTAAFANSSRQISEPALTTGRPAQVIQSACTLTLTCIFIFLSLGEIDNTLWGEGIWSLCEKDTMFDALQKHNFQA